MKPNFGKLGGLEHCGEQSRVVVGVHRSSQYRRKDTVALLPFASRPLSFLILGLAMAQQSHQAQLRYAEFPLCAFALRLRQANLFFYSKPQWNSRPNSKVAAHFESTG